MTFWRKPLDAEQLRSPRGVVHIIEERCKGCGFCVEFCPRGVLAMSPRTNPKGYHPPEVIDAARCVDCGLCTLVCPDFAIYVEGETPAPEKSSPTLNTDTSHV